MGLLLQNVCFLYGEEFAIRRGDLLVTNGTFAEILEPNSYAFEDEQDLVVLDGSENVVIPGMINCHCHILDAAEKECWPGLTIPELFGPTGIKNGMIEKTDEQILKDSASKSLSLMLKNGVTTAAVFVENGQRGLDIVRNCCGSDEEKTEHCTAKLLARPLNNKETNRTELSKLLENAHGFAPGSLSGLSSQNLIAMKTLVEETNIRERKRPDFEEWKHHRTICTHIAEVRPSGNFGRAVDAFGCDFVVHGNYLTDEQLRKMAECNVGLVCCIRSGSTFGRNTPDLLKLEEIGVKFAFGTDNVMSNTPDLFRELEFVTRKFMFEHKGKLPLSPERILRAATYDAAQLLGISNLGIIKEGFIADAIVLDINEDLTPFKGAISVIMRAGVQHISHVILKGELVFTKNNK